MEGRWSSENKRNWESGGLGGDYFEVRGKRLMVLVSHISRKTSEIWGTPRFVEGRKVEPTPFLEGRKVEPTPFLEGRNVRTPHFVEGRLNPHDL